MSANEVIREIDKGLRALDGDRGLLGSLAPLLLPEFDDLRHRVSESLRSCLQQIALGEEDETHSELRDLQERLVSGHARLFSEAADTAARRVERVLRNPFWVGERAPYLEVVEPVLRSKEQTVGTERRPLHELRTTLEDIARVERRLAGDERRARIRLPLQILLWGLPVIVGLWVSDRLSAAQNLGALVVLILIAVGGYVAIRFRPLARMKDKRPWSEVSARAVLMVSQLVLVLLGGAVVSLDPLNDWLVKRQMALDIGPIEQAMAAGDTLAVPFEIHYRSANPAVGVILRLEAPGIIRGDDFVVRFNALAASKPEYGSFAVPIPDDIPSGRYNFELRLLFTADNRVPTLARWRGQSQFTRSIRISVPVS